MVGQRCSVLNLFRQVLLFLLVPGLNSPPATIQDREKFGTMNDGYLFVL